MYIIMKRIAIILSLVLSVFTLSAQRGDGGQRGSQHNNGERPSTEERQAQELAQMTKVLSLTPDQIVSLKEKQNKLTEDIEKKRANLTKDSDRKVVREEMMKMREQYNVDVKKLLTDEQKVKYETYLKERESKMKERQGQGQRPGDGERGQGRARSN